MAGNQQRLGTDRPTARDPELAVCPNKNAAPNGLSFAGGVAHLRGYQEFSFDPTRRHLAAIGPQLAAKEQVVGRAFSARYIAGRTVLDLGGNNGFFAFKALNAGAVSAEVVDIDAECIGNLEQVRARFPELPLELHRENFDRWQRPADVVLALALVHWVYSCTAHSMSLERIVGKLAGLARDILVVEWVDPSDPAIEGYHHLELAEAAAAEPYDFDSFQRALSRHFARVELLGELSASRRIYLASRAEVPDLSWSAPLLFPKETLLTSRLLWTSDETAFWSRVYRVGKHVVRQCTPDLARREVACATALGIEFEILQQHEDWWLLRTAFIDGETLDEWTARNEPKCSQILEIALQLLDHVGRLRQVGLVHRDMHPANIIVDGNTGVHLIDFGWAVVPGLPAIHPSGLGTARMPATDTVIHVHPPESTGDDLFAVGRIAAWMNRGRDSYVRLLADWLSHADLAVRLHDVEVARQLVAVMLESCRPSADPPQGTTLDR